MAAHNVSEHGSRAALRPAQPEPFRVTRLPRSSPQVRWFAVLMVAHFVAAAIHIVWVRPDPHSDAMTIQRLALEVHSIADWFPLWFGSSDVLPPLDGGASTYRVVAIAAAIQQLFGASIVGPALVFSTLGACGQALLAHALLPTDASPRAVRWTWACVALPSAVFWSSMLLKEALATLFVGVVAAGTARLAAPDRRGGAVWLVAGLLGLLAFKPYLFLPIALGCGAWLGIATTRTHPGWAAVGAAALAGLVACITLEFVSDRYAPSLLLEQIAVRRALAARDVAGSALGGTGASDLASLATTLPASAFATLFAPTLMGARSPTTIAAALENAGLMLAVVAAARGALVFGFRRHLTNGPFVFAGSAALAALVGVALTATNLGSVSRHRSPWLPLVAYSCVVLAGADRKCSAGSNDAGRSERLPRRKR